MVKHTNYYLAFFRNWLRPLRHFDCESSTADPQSRNFRALCGYAMPSVPTIAGYLQIRQAEISTNI